MALAEQLINITRRTAAAGETVRVRARTALASQAQVQSRRVLAEARAALLNSALRSFVAALYDGAPDIWYNVAANGAIRTPTPWSRERHGAYGLSDPESRILRAHIVGVLEALPPRRALFWYCQRGARWHLNRGSYSELSAALDWLAGPGNLAPVRLCALESAIPRRGQHGG